MVVRKLEPGKLSGSEFAQFADIERAGRSSFSELRTLKSMLQRQDTYACFQDGQMAAYITFDRNYPYFGGSLHIAQMKPRWDCFTDEVLRLLVCEAVKQCGLSILEHSVTVDVHKNHDLLTPVYRSLGFQESIQGSSLSSDYAVLVASPNKLTAR